MTDAVMPLWKRVSLRADVDFKDEPAQSCFLSKVFHYWSGRNAYWGTWSLSEAPGDAAYAPDPETLKRRIERERVQGTHFNIAEQPAIAIMGKTVDLLLTHTSATPFDVVALERVTGSTIVALAKAVHAETSWYGNTFITTRGHARLAILPFKSYGSIPLGPGHRLGWSTYRQSVDIAALVALVGHIAVSLHGKS
jgi:hypothetical protein